MLVGYNLTLSTKFEMGVFAMDNCFKLGEKHLEKQRETRVTTVTRIKCITLYRNS